MKRTTITIVAMLCMVGLLAGSSSAAKEKNKGSPMPKNRMVVPKEKSQSMPMVGRLRNGEQRFREALGATEEQWKTLGPQVMKVNGLVQQLEEQRMSGVRAERQGRPAATPQTPLLKATVALQKLLADPASTPEAIKMQVAAVRQERETVRKDLQTARMELQSMLSERQQAQALLLGFLE